MGRNGSTVQLFVQYFTGGGEVVEIVEPPHYMPPVEKASIELELQLITTRSEQPHPFGSSGNLDAYSSQQIMFKISHNT